MEPEREGRKARVESLALEVKIVEVEAVEVVVEGGRRRLDKWRKRTFHPASEKRRRWSRALVK